MAEQDKLLEGILDSVKKEVQTDSYPMSIGELVNMYGNNELVLRPEYQRYFRWSEEQKSKLIESILIGLPLPSFFMAEDEKGNWEVVDGMQRISTILDFMGALKEEATSYECYKPFNKLTGDLFYLKKFSNKSWKDLSRRIQLDFKRAKIQITILKRSDNSDAKFELFQRLNSGGTSISSQELRNAILASEKPDLLEWLESLADNENFKKTTGLSEKDKSERYDVELVLRFIVFLSDKAKELKNCNSVSIFLTRSMRQIIKNDDFDFGDQQDRFDKTFEVIFKAGGENTLKYKNNPGTGKFSIAFFEAVALGIAQNIDEINCHDSQSIAEISDKIKTIGKDSRYTDVVGSGKNIKPRINALLNLGKQYFSSQE